MTKTIGFPGGLRKVGRVQPRYQLEVAIKDEGDVIERTWIEFTPAGLLTWSRVRTAIFTETDVLPKLECAKKETPQEVWETLLDDLTEDIEYEDAPMDASEAGLLYETAMEFVTGLAIADSSEHFALGGRRYETRGTTDATGRTDKPSLIVFRAKDLRNHLGGLKLLPKPREVWSALEPRGFGAGVQKVEGRPFRVWWIRPANLERWESEQGGRPARNGLTEPPVTEKTGLRAYSADGDMARNPVFP